MFRFTEIFHVSEKHPLLSHISRTSSQHVKKFTNKQNSPLLSHSKIHTVTFLIKCVKGFFEIEGARYSRLTYFHCKRNIILGAWAQMCLRMCWGGVLSFPRLCEQGDSLLCLDIACACAWFAFSQMSSAVVTLKFTKCSKLVSQCSLWWLS